MTEKKFDKETFYKNLSVHLRLGATSLLNIRAPECLKPKLFLHFDPTFYLPVGNVVLSHELFGLLFFSPLPQIGSCFRSTNCTSAGSEQQLVRSETASGRRLPC